MGDLHHGGDGELHDPLRTGKDRGGRGVPVGACRSRQLHGGAGVPVQEEQAGSRVDLQVPPQTDQDVTRVPLWARQVGPVRDAVALVAPDAVSSVPSPEPPGAVPTTWCDDAVPPWLVMRSTGDPIPTVLDCEVAVAAALSAPGAPDDVLRAEFHRGSLCPAGAICTAEPQDRGFVVLHGETSDVVIGVEANADGAVRVLLPAATPAPVASAAP